MAEEYLSDDDQLDAFKRLVAENWLWVTAGIVLGLGVLYGYRYYQHHRDAVALQASIQFDAMTDAVQRNDRNAALQIAAGLIKDYAHSPYADQSQLTIARLQVDDGQPAKAIPPLTEVMNNSKDTELRQIARLRLARVLIDLGKPDDAIRLLADGTPGAFAASYHEIRGDAFYAKKDMDSALKEFEAALAGGIAGGVDTALLQLKIADLGADPRHSMANVISNKAKP